MGSPVTHGTTSLLKDFPLRDSTTGLYKTGILFGGVTSGYVREGDSAETSISVVTMTAGTWTSGGFVELGSTGRYQFGVPDACLTSGANEVRIRIAASGVITHEIVIPLEAVDRQQGDFGIQEIEDLADGGRLDVILDQAAADAATVAAAATEARLAELDGANLPTDVANVKTDTVAIAAAATEARLAELDAGNIPSDIDSLVTSIAAVQADLPIRLTKNTAFPNFAFVMEDSSNNPLPGLTVTAQRRIDSGAFAACANSVSEVLYGAYSIDLAASDLNGDAILFRFTADGAKDLFLFVATQAT